MGLGVSLAIGTAFGQAWSSYKSYQSTKSANNILAANALRQGQFLNMQAQMQASMFAQQSQMHGMQADALRQQAEFTRTQSLWMAAAETQKAGIEQQEHDRELERVAKQRRLLIGAGLIAYAGNGVLLESRPDSAASRWEQDEMSDLAVEMVMMRHESDKEVWGFLRNSASIKFQGEQDAYALRLQSLAADMEAANAMTQSGMARLSGASALTDAYYSARAYRANTKSARYSMYGQWAQSLGSLSQYGSR